VFGSAARRAAVASLDEISVHRPAVFGCFCGRECFSLLGCVIALADALAFTAATAFPFLLVLPTIRSLSPWVSLYLVDTLPGAARIRSLSAATRCRTAMSRPERTGIVTVVHKGRSSRPCDRLRPVQRTSKLRHDRQVGMEPHTLDPAHAERRERPFVLRAAERALDARPR
jgi:hypothetical protein